MEEVTKDISLKNYVDGDSIRYLDYILSVADEIDSIEFFKELSIWVEKQNNIGKLPILEKGMKCLEIVIVTPRYYDRERKVYEIKIRLKYYKKGRV